MAKDVCFIRDTFTMSDAQMWGRTCESAFNQPLSQLLSTNWGMAGFVIMCFALAAAASIFKFVFWFRASHEERKAMWLLLGYFTASCFTANFFGSIAFFASAAMLDNFYRAYNDATVTMGDKMLYISVSNSWQAVYEIFSSLAFMFLSCAMLMILHRMLEFSLRVVRVADLGTSKPVAFHRFVMYAVVFMNFAGFVSNIASAALNVDAAYFFSKSAAEFNSGQNVTGFDFMQRASIENDRAQNAASVQEFCEVISLVVVLVSFTGIGLFCVSSLSSVENEALLSTATQSSHPKIMDSFKRMKRRIFGTVAVVFATFVSRTSFSILNAVAAAGMSRGSDPNCNLCDYSCQSVYDLIYIWLAYTPQYQISMEFFSCPLATLIALWGMSDDKWKRKQQSLLQNSRSGHSFRAATV